jgi:hypothetical protein
VGNRAGATSQGQGNPLGVLSDEQGGKEALGGTSCMMALAGMCSAGMVP